MTGLPASGKSTIAKALALRMNGLIIDKDIVRASLFAPEDIEYSDEQDDFIIGIIFQLVKHLLSRDPDRTIILDGRPYGRRYQREVLYKRVKEMDAKLKIIECICSDESARKRLEASILTDQHLAGNRDFSLYQRLKKHWEKIEKEHLVLNTDENDQKVCVQMALEYLVGE